MRKALLFSAVAAIGLFVTVEPSMRPQAAFQADFEPATQAETLQLGVLAPKLSAEETYIL
jgi:hypothetical protein